MEALYEAFYTDSLRSALLFECSATSALLTRVRKSNSTQYPKNFITFHTNKSKFFMDVRLKKL